MQASSVVLPALLLAIGTAGGSEPLALDDGLNEEIRALCDTEDARYASRHYKRCCSKGRYRRREAVCRKARPSSHPEERTPAWPKLRTDVDSRCNACARLVDNLEMG